MKLGIKIFGWMLTGLSLLICVAAMIFWSRSHQHQDSLTLLGGRAYSIASFRSEIWIEAVTPITLPPPGKVVGIHRGTYRDHWELRTEWPLYAPLARWSKTAIYRGSNAGGGYAVEAAYFYMPHWLVALGAALLPAVRLTMFFIRRHQRMNRSAGNFCAACHYDLRASSERCPECGLIPSGSRHALPH